jgi:hypothetical protein
VAEAELGQGRELARGLGLTSGEAEKLPEGWTQGRARRRSRTRGLDSSSGEAKRLHLKGHPLGLSYWASHRKASGDMRALSCASIIILLH